MVIITTGGRDYENVQCIRSVMIMAKYQFDIIMIANGDCKTGADRHVRRWANEQHIFFKPWPADWTRYGKAAGPIRNREMLEYYAESKKDCRLIAFPGNDGTNGTVEIADELGILVMDMRKV